MPRSTLVSFVAPSGTSELRPWFAGVDGHHSVAPAADAQATPPESRLPIRESESTTQLLANLKAVEELLKEEEAEVQVGVNSFVAALVGALLVCFIVGRLLVGMGGSMGLSWL